MMAAPPQFLDGGLPSVFKDSKADPFRQAMGIGFRGHAKPSPIMPIPGSHDLREVPPPLPPPKFLPSFQRDPNPFSNDRDDRPDYLRRFKPDHDEGYASMSSASTRTSDSYSQGLPSLSEFGLSHMQFSTSSSIDDYDKDIKRKLDPIRTFNTASPTNRSLLSASMHEPTTRRYAPETRLAPLSVPAALPFHTRNHPTFDSPSRYAETPLSARSPRSTPFSITSDYRSPHDAHDFDRSPRYRSRRANSGSVPDDATVASSTQGSYGEDDMELDSAAEPTTSISRLRIIDDYHQSLPQKRRALSPPSEDAPTPTPPTLHGMPSQGDLFRQRNLASRGSPTPRLSMNLQPATSIASTMSTGSARSASSGFTVASNVASYGRRSPNSGLSPGALSPVATEVSCSSPYMTPTSNPSPRVSIARAPHQRGANCGKLQAFHMCECCPKKPKKFETEEELRAHELEKQYECSFCGNRFKNKNEAERHQNSLHVRRHSWSCSALFTYDKAFHESTNRPGEADVCGYCGDEFARSGSGSGSGGPRVTTDEDWVERNRHLQEVHKFRECNSSKKFYRADHFRQHLKHSHQGTSGKWTNMLENACMMEEEPPVPIR